LNPIVIYSTKGGNTQKVAEEIASELNCDSLRITKAVPIPTFDLNNYDLIIVGTGIHGGNPYEDIVAYLNTIELKEPKTFAIFITWGGALRTNQVVFSKIKNILELKNQKVLEDFFSCYGGWKILRRGRPKMEDFKVARIWAQELTTMFSE
jgi:flavodoxin